MASEVDLISSTPTSRRFIKAGCQSDQVQDILHQLPKDFQLICTDGRIKIHRLVLMSASSFLWNLILDEDHKETSSLILADVTVEQLKKVAILLYHGQIVVEGDEIEQILEILYMLKFPVEELFSRVATENDLSLQETVSSRFEVEESGSDGCGGGLPNNFSDYSLYETRKRRFEVISLVHHDVEVNPAKSLCRRDISQNDNNQLELDSASGNFSIDKTAESLTPNFGSSHAVELEKSGFDKTEENLTTKSTVSGSNSSLLGPHKGTTELIILDDVMETTNSTQVDDLPANPGTSMSRRVIFQNDSNLEPDGGSASDNICDVMEIVVIQPLLGSDGATGDRDYLGNHMEIDCAVLDDRDVVGESSSLNDEANHSVNHGMSLYGRYISQNGSNLEVNSGGSAVGNFCANETTGNQPPEYCQTESGFLEEDVRMNQEMNEEEVELDRPVIDDLEVEAPSLPLSDEAANSANPVQPLFYQSDSDLEFPIGSALGNFCDDKTTEIQQPEYVQEKSGFIEKDVRWNPEVNQEEVELDRPVVFDIGEEAPPLSLSDATKDLDFPDSLDELTSPTSQRGDEEAARHAGAEGASTSQNESLSDKSISSNDLEELNEVDQFLISASDFDIEYRNQKVMARESEGSKAPEPAPVEIDVHKINSAKYAENMVKGPSFKLLKKDDGSCAIHCAAQLGNQKLVKCLLENGVCTLDETDFNGNTPLHIATQKLDHLSLLFPYLMERGATLYAVNDEGLTPMFMALKCVDIDTLGLLIQMEEKGLQMEDYARDALIILFRKYFTDVSSNRQDLRDSLLRIIRYFIEKGGVIHFDHHSSIMSWLVQTINFDEVFLRNAERILGIRSSSSPEFFVSRLQAENVTLEKLVLCLLESNQLKVAVEFVNEFLCKKATKYCKGYSGVREALASDNGVGRVVMIRAQEKDICLNRVIDTMVNVKRCKEDEIPKNTTEDDLYVLTMEKLTSDILSKLQKEVGKFIVVAESMAPGLEQDFKVVEDSIRWDDLSREARYEFGTPGDFCGFRFGEESFSLFLRCLVELSPRKIRGEDCFTFFQFLNGIDLINLMKRRTTITDIMGDLFDECVRDLSNDEVQILEEIAVKDTFGFRPTSVSENLIIMEDLVTKKWLVKEVNDFKFRNKVTLSYFLAQRILRLPRKLSPKKTKFLFRTQKKQFKLFRRLSIDARVFIDDTFVYFMDRLLGKMEGSALDLSFNKISMTNFVEACAASNAHNLLKLLNRRMEISCESRCIIHLLACGTVLLPEQRIVERKELIQKLISQGDRSHLEEVTLIHWNGSSHSGSFLPVDMPFTHVEIIKTLIELDSKCQYKSHEATFAHLAPRNMPVDQFEELVQFLVRKGLASKYFSVNPMHHWNPLEPAEDYFKRRPAIISMLISAGVSLKYDPIQNVEKYYCVREDKSVCIAIDYYKI